MNVSSSNDEEESHKARLHCQLQLRLDNNCRDFVALFVERWQRCAPLHMKRAYPWTTDATGFECGIAFPIVNEVNARELEMYNWLWSADTCNTSFVEG